MANSKTNTNPQVAPTPTHPHHYIRTPLASFFGFLAVILIISTTLVFWLNRTLTDTSAFTGTFAPLVEEAEIQQFIAMRGAESVMNSAPIEEISTVVLSDKQRMGASEQQLKTLAHKEVETRILNVVSSPQFASVWRDGIESIHSQVTTQLKSDSEIVTFDFSSIINQALTQLAKTGLGIDPKDTDLGKDAGKLSINRDELGPVTQAYDSLQGAVYALIAGAVIALAACVILSVHHMKTLRRVLMATGVFTLILFGLLNAPSFIETSGINPVDHKAVQTMFEAVFSDLKTALLIVSGASFAVAIGSKIIELVVRRRHASKN